MPGIDQYVVFGSHLDGEDAATVATDFSTQQAAKDITFNGNRQLDTADFKFGTASALYDGSGDFLSLADSGDWDFGTADWTIDVWVNFANTGGNQTIFEMGKYSAGAGMQCQLEGGTSIKIYIAGGSADYSGSWTPS